MPIHSFARALHVFGEIEDLANILHTACDDIGLTLMDENLTKQTRAKSSSSGHYEILPRRLGEDMTQMP
ncbi:hypothetical protein ABK905_11975 [Acerihabitans sp. KWT182]|uniref:Uncharacterized protein n=1 Tax=Acerihabitans sp. KWT182 TaxID=3157919 RepID=A0AAU7QG29_9GAMM